MIQKFEKGKYYRCLLNKRGDDWNDEGEMDEVLDGELRKAKVINPVYPNHCLFKDMKFNGGGLNGCWRWGLDEFEEVDELQLLMITMKKKLLKSNKKERNR